MLRDALPADPAGRELLPLLERTARSDRRLDAGCSTSTRGWRAGRPELSDRVQLLRLRAEVREKRMHDPSGALDELVRSFALGPDNAETHEEILRLAGVTGRWEDALKVEAQLFALAEDLPRKLSVARHAAALVENEVKDLVRAFRAYLNAFRLAPEDTEIVGAPVAAGGPHRALRRGARHLDAWQGGLAGRRGRQHLDGGAGHRRRSRGAAGGRGRVVRRQRSSRDQRHAKDREAASADAASDTPVDVDADSSGRVDASGP